MALLVELGLLERLVAILEVGAGILPVAIEEEIVELSVEIVVMRHVALRPANRIVLLDDADQARPEVRQLDEGRRFELRHVATEQIEQVVDVAILDGERAVHEGLAEGEAWAKHEAKGRPAVMNPHGDRGAGTRALHEMRPTGRIDDCQLAFPQYAGKNLC